uniref:ORF108 n=1 Tax=Xanthomonas hortorum pv. vitians TaxID=83224 RepID=Q5D0M3_9XANT|nr:ORF108 [Xanthomonas campestris pv. vitians]
MKVNLSFVPPGGGESDYSLPIEMPEIPRAGDYLSVEREGHVGTENFIVRRTWWNLHFDEAKGAGTTKEIWVECEFALSPFSSESHKRSCAVYETRKGKLLEFDESMY